RDRRGALDGARRRLGAPWQAPPGRDDEGPTALPQGPTEVRVVTSARTADVGGVTVSLDHYVNGERVGSADTFDDRSPLDWTLKLGDVARGDEAVAPDAVTAAIGAADGWAALGPAGRATILRRLADLIDEHVEPLATVECLDMALLQESLRARAIALGARDF